MYTVQDLNRKAAELSMGMIAIALQKGDTEFIRKMKHCGDRVFDSTIAMMELKPDYETWYAHFIEVNTNPKYTEWDTEGKMKAVGQMVIALDVREHYDTVIVPLIEQGVDALLIEQAAMHAMFDLFLNECVRVRRSALKAV